jgi:hypothetical protein
MARALSGRGRWPAAFAVAACALAIGALLATPRDSRATSSAAPVNTGTPTISGTPQENQTLSADHGEWSDSPTSYDYAWSRCDKNGDGCKSIDSATSSTYQLQQSDVGHALRVTVTATNGDGASTATSAPSAVIAQASPPSNTSVPVITGTVTVGSTLTGDSGSWSGDPTSYAYQWSRCDENGGSCAAIGGATAQTYLLKQVDAGTTLRFTASATNSAGSTTATSAPTAVVPSPSPSTYTPPAAVATGCPSGTGVVQVADVSPPARLAIDQQTVAPGVVTLEAVSIQVHFRVTACGGRPVQGALVYATAVPFNQYSIPPEATTGADGSATLTMTQQGGFPAARQQRLLVVFVRARKPGEPVDGGISSRLLVSFPVSVSG